MRYAALIAILAVFWPSQAAALDVIFQDRVEVEGESITLGDIAEFSNSNDLAKALSSQVVCPAPDVGDELGLDSRAVILHFVRGNNSLSDIMWRGASRVSVTRKSVTITTKEILGVIDDYIGANSVRLPQADIRFLAESLPLPFLVPTGRLEWEVVPSSPDIIGSSRFALICKVNGRVQKNFSVLGRIEAIAPVVIALKTLQYGDIISEDSVELAPRDLADLDNYTNVLSLVIGSQVTRTIRSGTSIDTTAIEQPPLVRRGELVKIFIDYHGLQVRATGIAKSDGRKDEMIRVRNSSSNKLIHCRVEAPGIVEVRL